MEKDLKDILLKDLCARLPYGVKVQIDLQSNICPPITCKVCNIEFTETEGSFIGVETSPDTYNEFREFLCKPYLFPLSSMTEEQKEELLEITDAIKIDDIGIYYEEGDTLETYLSKIPYTFMCNVVTWCYKNHLDINNLIPLGLANDATGLNIY